MNKPFALAVRVSVFASAVCVCSWGGVFGNLQYAYFQESNVDPLRTSTKTTALQQYMLGYRGYVYSPRLFNYDVYGGFLLNSSRLERTGESGTSSSRLANYKINMDVLQGSKYPFSISAEKTNTPYDSVQTGGETHSDQSTNSYDIKGNLKLSGVNVNYGIKQTDGTTTGNIFDEKRSDRSYNLGLQKKLEKGSLSASLSSSSRSYSQLDERLRMSRSVSDNTRGVALSTDWSFSKALITGASASYNQNDFIGMKTISLSSFTKWTPSQKYNASLNLMGNQYSVGSGSAATNITAMVNSFYAVSKELTTNQNVQIFKLSSGGDGGSSTMAVLSSNAQYAKKLANDVGIMLGVDINIRSENSIQQSMTYTITPDENVTDEQSPIQKNSHGVQKTSLGYGVSASASKFFEKLMTSVSGGGGFRVASSGANEGSKSYNLSFSLTTTPTESFSYTLNTSYASDVSRFAFTDSGPSTKTSTIFTIDNSISYWKDIGSDGRLSLSGGVNQSTYKSTDSGSLTKMLPHANAFFNYKITRRLVFNTSATATQSKDIDMVSYGGTATLGYTLRQITVMGGASKNIQQGGTSKASNNIQQTDEQPAKNVYNSARYSQSMLFFRVTRKF